jgi:hypothetical protein
MLVDIEELNCDEEDTQMEGRMQENAVSLHLSGIPLNYGT